MAKRLIFQMPKRKRSVPDFRKSVRRRFGDPALRLARTVGEFGDVASTKTLRNWANPNRIFKFVETVWNRNAIGQSAAGDVQFAYSFSLSDLNNVTEYASLFDQYRIVLIEVDFIPVVTQNNGDNKHDYGRLITAIDLDDANGLTAAQLSEYSTCRITNSTSVCKRKWVPHTAEAAYAGVFTSYSNKTGAWIDLGSPGVLYYGIKGVLTAANALDTTLQNLKLVFRYHLEFKANR